MSLTNASETALLNLMFANENFANVGDATGLRGSSTAGSFYISLHQSSPGEAAAGGQQENEADYTGYARVAVARTSGAWTVSGNSVVNASSIAFGACISGSNTITHFGIGTSSSGAGSLLFFGSIGSLAVSAGITPAFAPGAMTITAD